MTRSKAALVMGVALGSVLLVAGCSAGQIAETAEMQPAVPGANSTPMPGAGADIQLRNVLIAYPGESGYQQGATAPLELLIANTGEDPVTLTKVETDAASSVTLSSSASASPSSAPSGSASPSASASPSPSASPAGEPVRVSVPTDGYVTFSSTSQPTLQLVGLTRRLGSGESARITFTFDNGASFTLDVPVGVPLTPVPQGSALFGGSEE